MLVPPTLPFGSIPAEADAPVPDGTTIKSISLVSNLKLNVDEDVIAVVNGVSTVMVFVVPLYETTRLISPADGPESIVTVAL